MKKVLLIASVLFVAVVSTACINNLAVQDLNNKAKMYADKGDYTQAIERLKSSIDLDPSVFETHYNLAVVYTQAEDYINAVEEYKKEYERSREGTGKHRVVDLMSLDLKLFVEERKQSELLSYLLSLNFESLKVVQTVMYIGRDYETMIQTEFDDEYDGEYDEEDFRRNTISLPVPNPDFVLYEWLRDLGECKGWQSKRIEAEQIYQKKLSLHTYLNRAFRILGIER